MTMAEMLALGAPKLPEDLFYRVDSDTWGRLTIQIRQERRIGSKFLVEAYDYPNMFPDIPPREMLQKTATKAYDYINENSALSDRWAVLRMYEGDHK